MAFKRERPSVSAWTIAAGVAMGILAAHAVDAAAVYVSAKMAIAVVQNDMRLMQEKQTREAQEQDAKLRATEAARKIAEAVQQRESAKIRFAEIEAATRREEAWKRFYKPKPECSQPPDNAAFTRCANEHIRAQRAFEMEYRP